MSVLYSRWKWNAPLAVYFFIISCINASFTANLFCSWSLCAHVWHSIHFFAVHTSLSSISRFKAYALFLALDNSVSSHPERPRLSLSVCCRAYSVLLMEQSTIGRDNSLTLVHLSSQSVPCYYCRPLSYPHIATHLSNASFYLCQWNCQSNYFRLCWFTGMKLKAQGCRFVYSMWGYSLYRPHKWYPLSYVNEQRVKRVISE